MSIQVNSTFTSHSLIIDHIIHYIIHHLHQFANYLPLSYWKRATFRAAPLRLGRELRLLLPYLGLSPQWLGSSAVHPNKKQTYINTEL